MTFTLSIPAMLRQLYARGAMAWAVDPSARPDILRPAHEPAIRELLRGSFARLCLDMMRHVVSTNLDEVDPATDDIFVVELDIPAGIDTSTLRAAMEMAVAMRALSGAMTGIAPAEAAEVASEAARALTYIESVTALRDCSRLRLTPYWN